MKQQVTNFGRFYSAFHKLTIHGEPDEAKRQFVLQYTAGRTDSLKEMTRKEYTDLCIAIEGMNGTRDELKRRRSIALKLMQELEVDTTDWAQINDFCRHPPNLRESLRAALDRGTDGTRHQAPLHKAQGMAAQEVRTDTNPGNTSATYNISHKPCRSRHDKLQLK